MRLMFRVTYDVITPESAENGDSAENGFLDSYGFRDPIAIALKEPRDAYNMTLRDALKLVASCVEDSGHWFTEVDGRDDYQTGEHETRALHPPKNITPSSYARLRRLLNA